MEDLPTLEEVRTVESDGPGAPVVPPISPVGSVISRDRRPRFLIRRVLEASSDPAARRRGMLARLEGWFLRLTRAVDSALPEPLNPFVQIGAIANTTFAIALVTGVLLLFWYVPSVHQAHDSVLGMEAAPLFAGLIRTLHRYSSDACILFVLLHAFQTLIARKVGPARRIGWVSGVFMAGVLWFDGWTGYWLVWDDAARQVALGSSRMLDALPLFRDQVSRSFLTDESVNTLMFFIVFFIHMLIPLALGAALWVHVMRLNRARFFTGRALTLVIIVTLVALSMLAPVAAGGPARMAEVPESVAWDPFYLLPLLLTDRLEGGMLWAVSLSVGVVLFSLPWWIARRRPAPAAVDEDTCNGCSLCYADCPYDAIALLSPAARSRPHARVDPAKCVGCGICVGACDSNAIDVPLLPAADVRRWLNETVPDGSGGKHVAFVCAHSAAAELEIDAHGVTPSMPGYRVVPVPCSGWVHALTIERALRRGAAGVLVVGCGSDPVHRLGHRWTHNRLAGSRSPALRRDRVDPARVRHVRFDRTDRQALRRAAESFRLNSPSSPSGPRTRGLRVAVALAVLVGFAAAVALPNQTSYFPPGARSTELVVSFKHAGAVVETAVPSTIDQEKLLPHMRAPVATLRKRMPVRISVTVDGREVVRRHYPPGGVFGDGSSIAMERVPVAEGWHRVEIRLDDTGSADRWSHETADEILFRPGTRRVVTFDRTSGFVWH